MFDSATMNTLEQPISPIVKLAFEYIKALDLKLTVPEWARVESAFVAGFEAARSIDRSVENIP